ncbi:universal stress protein [Hippea jasoniae]|uniref:universal stress protein n=1 Tax=Hippea jasoniae TaxID=944479 RepID=UPI0005507779|nr:universal stress protein [Hippea jasoniae]
MDYGIVVVAKGSEVGLKAAKEAVKIAKDKNYKEIYLLFVNDPNFYSGEGISVGKDDVSESLKHIGDAVISKLTDYIKKEDQDLEVRSIILYGATAEEIVKFLQVNKVDVFIIPKDKRGPIERSIVGGDIEPFYKEIAKLTNCVVVG